MNRLHNCRYNLQYAKLPSTNSTHKVSWIFKLHSFHCSSTISTISFATVWLLGSTHRKLCFINFCEVHFWWIRIILLFLLFLIITSALNRKLFPNFLFIFSSVFFYLFFIFCFLSILFQVMQRMIWLWVILHCQQVNTSVLFHLLVTYTS